MAQGFDSTMARSEPERRCLVTRQSLPRGALVRFVVGPDGRIAGTIESFNSSQLRLGKFYR